MLAGSIHAMATSVASSPLPTPTLVELWRLQIDNHHRHPYPQQQHHQWYSTNRLRYRQGNPCVLLWHSVYSAWLPAEDIRWSYGPIHRSTCILPLLWEGDSRCWWYGYLIYIRERERERERERFTSYSDVLLSVQRIQFFQECRQFLLGFNKQMFQIQQNWFFCNYYVIKIMLTIIFLINVYSIKLQFII